MASLNFNTSNDTFRQLLGNGLSYKVPPYQRDYSWTDNEWDDLWQDIIQVLESKTDDAHYMGYLVRQSEDNKQFEIIDGQQRITTISIIVLAAISCLSDLSESDDEENSIRAKRLRESYIGYLDPVTLIPQSKLSLNRHNDDFYQAYLVPLRKHPQRGLNASERLLGKSFAWFKEQIKQYVEQDGKSIAELIENIVDKLFFTVITVTDQLNAFKVFETLNSRGVRLSSTDLLKNHLFSVVDSELIHDADMKTLERQWDRIVGTLGDEKFPEFLRVYWNSRNKLVRKSDLFKTIRDEINNKEEVFSLIHDLDLNANFYRALRSPSDELWETNESRHIRELQMFSVRQPMSLLLAAYAKFGDDDRASFYKILHAISVISFRYNVICNLQTNEQEPVYNNVAVKLSSGMIKTAQGVIQDLKHFYPDDQSFRASFKNKELRTTNNRNKKIVRYILFRLEHHLGQPEYDFESGGISIEHIMPERIEDQWDYINDSDHEKFVYRLGNMTLLHTGENRDIGNSGYSDKKPIYEKSKFALTRKVSEDFDNWNLDTIRELQIWMAKQATSIWRIEF